MQYFFKKSESRHLLGLGHPQRVIRSKMQKVQEGYDEDFANVIYKIDMASLFVFASMFALFNSLYWYKFSI